MKKFYMLALSGFISYAVNAQIVVNDFESFSLAPESFDNGSSGSGGFTETAAFYENVYDDVWDSWTGFSISNVTDNTTAGWGNQYSAFAGSGFNSPNYAVYYYAGSITLQGWAMAAYLDSVKITNTTYAAIAMRDGDGFSKQFGSPLNADGNPDGTNGEDYFRIWIIGEYLSGLKDSVEFYLADYRFADDLDDYIVEDWVNVDLSSFTEAVTNVTFRFESSDMGAWGINTPTYFALDDFHFTTINSVEENYMDVALYPNPVVSEVTVNGGYGTLEIRDIEGKLLFTKEHNNISTVDMSSMNSGVYFLTIQSETGNFIHKLVK